MRTFAITLTGVAILFAGIQWWQIVYRLLLFYQNYHGERYANHVGDDVFTIIHVVNVVLLVSGVFCAWTFWREPGAWGWLAASITVTNAVAWLAFIYMHATGVLVGYVEFIQHWKGH